MTKVFSPGNCLSTSEPEDRFWVLVRNGDAAQILAECNAGKMFDRQQENEIEMWLMDAVNRWQQKFSFRDGNAEAEKYSRKELTRKLAGVLNNIP